MSLLLCFLWKNHQIIYHPFITLPDFQHFHLFIRFLLVFETRSWICLWFQQHLYLYTCNRRDSVHLAPNVKQTLFICTPYRPIQLCHSTLLCLQMLSVMRSQLEPLMPHVQQVQDWVVEHPRLALSSAAALLGATYLATSALKGKKNLPPGPRYTSIVGPYLCRRSGESYEINVACLWAAMLGPPHFTVLHEAFIPCHFVRRGGAYSLLLPHCLSNSSD